MANIDSITAADLAATAFDTDSPGCPAESVTYTAPGVAGVTIDAILMPEEKGEGTDGQGTEEIRRRSIIVQTAEVSDPKIGGTITVGSDTWRIVSAGDIGNGRAVLETVIDTDISRHDEDHYKRAR